MHEQSETIQRPDGKWINVYGRDTPKAGQQLPDTPVFDSSELAVEAAKERSASVGVTIQTATNPQTGERVVLHEGQWKPIEQSATNAEGKKAYLVGGQWITDDGIAAPQGGRGQDLSAVGAFAKGTNVGLAGMLGAPVDLINAGLDYVGLGSERPVGGSESLRSLLPESFTYGSMDEVPQEMRPIARAGEVVGASVPIAAAPFAVTKPLSEVNRFVRPVVAAARQAPGRFAAAEAGAAAGGAQGAAGAELLFPGNPTAALTGEIAGGIVNPVGAIARLGGRAVDSATTAARSFSRTGREAKAAEILQNAMRAVGEDPDAVARRLRESELPGVSMTAGQKADSPTLLAFETTLASKNPDFDAAMRARTKENFDGLRRLIGQMEASGDPELLRIAAKTREQYFQRLLEGRMTAAQAQAQQAARVIGGDQAASSTRATQIIEDALTDARKVEGKLWARVPTQDKVAGTGIIEAHANVRAGMLPEEPLPPSFVEQFVARVKDGGGVTAGDVQRFRSQMLLKAREARAQKKWGDARIYEDMADGALADLASLPGKAAAEARAWSKALHDHFTRTFAGDAMATKSTGADRIAPEAVLERGFGSGGTMAAKRFTEMENAAQFSGRSMIQEQEDFLRAAAQASVDPQTGIVNPRSLEGFMRKNETLLQRFPALRRDLADAATAEQTFRDVEAATKTASRAIQQRSAFAQVLANEGPADAVRRIVKSDHPQRDYANIVKLARRGPEGSVDGLKAATLDYAARAATSSTGEFSFSRYRQILNQPMSGRGPSILNTMRLHKVMSTEEMARLNAIIQNAERIERSVASKSRMSELMGEPDALFDLVVRAVGANIGGASSLGQAAGAPIVLAGAGSKAARNLFERVPRTRVMDVIAEAAKNPQFMARLLEKPSSPKQVRELHRQINAFLIQAGLVDREEAPEQPLPEQPQAPSVRIEPARMQGVRG